MDLIKAVIFGIVQGLTEFLPISSTAHLRILPALLGWEDPGAVFTAVIQLGTVLAVLLYFGKDLGRAFIGWFNSLRGIDKESDAARMGWAVFYGTIPVVILALVLHKPIETTFRSLYVIAGTLIFMGIVMFIADRKGNVGRDTSTVTVKDGIIVGFWQCLALLPGMSRSGSTISGALFQGFDRASAARLSFLMSVPSVTAAGLYEAFKERKAVTGDLLTPIAVATVVAFVVGYASIALLIRFLQKRGVTPFVAYRILLGLVLLGLLQSGKIQPDAGAKPLKEATAIATHVSKAS